VVGVLDVQSAQANRFSGEDLRVQSVLASQIAVAVENARLFAEATQSAAELQTVAEVSAEAATALDMDLLLMSVADLTKERFDLYHAHIYLLDESGEMLNLAAGAGFIGQAMVAAQHRIALNTELSVVARAARTREAVMINDVSSTPNFLPNPMLPDTASELALPMIAGDQLIGVMDVQSSQVGRFTERDIRVKGTLATQVAVSVQNARLFGEVQLEAERRAQLYDLAQNLSGTLDADRIAAITVQGVAELLDMPEVSIYRYDEEEQVLQMLAGVGETAEKMVGLLVPVQQSGSAARVIATRQPEIEPDIANTTRDGYEFAASLGFTASLLVPILIADQVIGALFLDENRGPRDFTPDEIRLVQNVAVQAGVALQNAYLYGEQVRVADQLREVDRLKSEFLASMSHELRTPLNSIIGYAEVLLDGIDGDLTDDMEEDVGAIHSSGKHLLNLINDILDLAKIEAGQMDLITDRLELRPFIEEVLTNFKVLLMGKPVELIIDVPEDIPDVQVDQLRLRQVVSNLATNAIKFTQEGSITVRAQRCEADMIMVSVIDTGIGISAQNLPLVFERFRQVDQSHTRRVGGTGLGLAITRQLVQMHGGDIWVESEPGVGSNFSFTIPVAAAE
ncbi:MAG: GAF domain-containing protein, partial [Chloroflexi bacterium]|nr:GAF domain-containing protein [Chloroflexota bacterium]